MTNNEDSPILKTIHSSVADLHSAGVVDKQTMRRFDDLCLSPIASLSPEEIRALREREHVSQAVFAKYLNVTVSLVSQWERGERRPAGPSLKLLNLVKRSGLTLIR